MPKFADWMTKNFLTWQSEQGKRKTIEDFAAYIGVSRPLLNQWMNGDIPRPGRENISRLADIFGFGIYDVLDIPRPNLYLQKINKVFEHLSPEHQQRLAEDAERYELENDRSKKISKQRKTAKAE